MKLLPTIKVSLSFQKLCLDNGDTIIERWFRSLKCENIYINEYDSPKALRKGVCEYVLEYNEHRPHQSLGYQTPAQVFFNKSVAA